MDLNFHGHRHSLPLCTVYIDMSLSDIGSLLHWVHVLEILSFSYIASKHRMFWSKDLHQLWMNYLSVQLSICFMVVQSQLMKVLLGPKCSVFTFFLLGMLWEAQYLQQAMSLCHGFTCMIVNILFCLFLLSMCLWQHAGSTEPWSSSVRYCGWCY